VSHENGIHDLEPCQGAEVTGPTPVDYASDLVQRVRAAAQAGGADPARWFVGCYLHGSAALGGWNPARSDVDLLLVVSAWTAPVSEAVAAAVTASVSACPGRGLECSVVLADAARRPREPWPFLLHVNSSGDVVRRVDGRDAAGDPDLLMHYAVTRARGVAVAGPAVGETFGEVPRQQVLRYLHDELDWGLRHGAAAYAVLNALRAMRFARDGRLLSKVEAGEQALDDPTLPAGLIGRALSQQRGDAEPEVPGDEARALVRRARAVLLAARVGG
jgi:streptomycin 3"-adenylyltransferase